MLNRFNRHGRFSTFEFKAGDFYISIADDHPPGNANSEGKTTIRVENSDGQCIDKEIWEDLFDDIQDGSSFWPGEIFMYTDDTITEVVNWCLDASKPRIKKRNYQNHLQKIMLVRLAQGRITEMVRSMPEVDTDLLEFATGMMNALDKFHDEDQYV